MTDFHFDVTCCFVAVLLHLFFYGMLVYFECFKSSNGLIKPVLFHNRPEDYQASSSKVFCSHWVTQLSVVGKKHVKIWWQKPLMFRITLLLLCLHVLPQLHAAVLTTLSHWRTNWLHHLFRLKTNIQTFPWKAVLKEQFGFMFEKTLIIWGGLYNAKTRIRLSFRNRYRIINTAFCNNSWYLALGCSLIGRNPQNKQAIVIYELAGGLRTAVGWNLELDQVQKIWPSHMDDLTHNTMIHSWCCNILSRFIFSHWAAYRKYSSAF